MKCADPVLCYNGKFRHYSLASPTFKALHKLVFDCGKCIFCRKKRSKELAIRCVLHASLYKQNCFLTLTYDETKEGYHNDFQYPDVQRFKKSLRRHCDYHYKKKIQVFNVHEYGKNGKKHWHLVVFNHDFDDKELHTVRKQHPLYRSSKLDSLWPYGFSSIGSVTEASALYQSQYMQKDLKNGNMTNEKKSHSKHSGIGKPYFLKHYQQILTLGFIPFAGKKVPIPRYFQKLAHRHYAHFYDPDCFFDFPHRKRLYRPFKLGEENKQIADLYKKYLAIKQEHIDKLTTEWDNFINLDLFNDEKPDFMISQENYLHDLANKQTQEKF